MQERLKEEIGKELLEYKYHEMRETKICNIDYIKIFSTPIKNGTRGVCPILKIPSEYRTDREIQEFYHKVKKNLENEYSVSPWKGLGSIIIFLINKEQMRAISSCKLHFYNMTGLDENIVLASFFVDEDDHQYILKKTWGLVFSNKILKGIKSVLDKMKTT